MPLSHQRSARQEIWDNRRFALCSTSSASLSQSAASFSQSSLSRELMTVSACSRQSSACFRNLSASVSTFGPLGMNQFKPLVLICGKFLSFRSRGYEHHPDQYARLGRGDYHIAGRRDG